MLASLTYLVFSLTWLSPAFVTAVGSAVLVYNRDQDQRGTGVVIARQDDALFILTAEHVVRGGLSIRCRYQTTKGPSVTHERVQVLLANGSLDLALLRVRDVTDPPRLIAQLAPANSDSFAGPFLAWSSGADESGQPRPRPERVNGKKLLRMPQGDERFAWECLQAAERGRSGGGLFDTRGFLVGICSGVQGGKAYYTHIDEVRFWLRRHEYRWLTVPELPRKPAK